MKMIMKFKDGITATQTYTEEGFKVVSSVNFLEQMMHGKERNSNITVQDSNTGLEVEKKYSDLYSIEIVFSD